MAGTTPYQNVTFPSNGATAHGYLQLPPSGTGAGLVVIQEWWGLTDHIKDVTDRLAAEGYVALAPDLYGGATTHDGDEAGELMRRLPVDRAARDLQGAADFLLGHEAVTSPKVGVVGFCMGGGFVVTFAAQAGEKVGAAVAFYGAGIPDDLDVSTIAAPVLGHFAEHDDWAPPEGARALFERIRAEAGVEAELHVYDGTGHAFFNDENLIGTYDAEAAAVAWDRTLRFLRERL